MSDFDDVLEEMMGDVTGVEDIRVVTRRCWFYDFDGYPTYMWQGNGRLFTTDGREWLGTIDATGRDIHNTPRLQDGRDGSSAAYKFSMVIPDIPGEPAGDIYAALKEDQSRVFGRHLTCFLAIFKPSEGLRPSTPLKFFKQLNMFSPTFNEGLIMNDAGVLVRSYSVSIAAKDSNFGRSKVPNRTYTDTNQREYARQMGVASPADLGCEYVTDLANKTFVIE